MSLRVRIALAFSLAAAAGVAYVAWWIRQEVRPQYLKSMEESLADTSALLAAELERDLRGGRELDVSGLRAVDPEVEAILTRRGVGYALREDW